VNPLSSLPELSISSKVLLTETLIIEDNQDLIVSVNQWFLIHYTNSHKLDTRTGSFSFRRESRQVTDSLLTYQTIVYDLVSLINFLFINLSRLPTYQKPRLISNFRCQFLHSPSAKTTSDINHHGVTFVQQCGQGCPRERLKLRVQ
jgi:hypothetical protein